MNPTKSALSLIYKTIAAYRPTDSAEEAASGEYTVDELARAAGSTVRNVRAYQDRGLLPPDVLFAVSIADADGLVSVQDEAAQLARETL